MICNGGSQAQSATAPADGVLGIADDYGSDHKRFIPLTLRSSPF